MSAKETRRQNIVHAATTLFRERGFTGTTYDDIAALAGVSRGTVFNHFPYKEALLVATFQKRFAPLFANWPLTPPDPLASIEQLLVETAQRALDDRPLLLPLAYELVNAVPERSRTAFLALPLAETVTHLIQHAQQQQLIRTDYSAERLARTIANTFFLTILQWAAYRSSVDITTEITLQLQLLFNGLRPR